MLNIDGNDTDGMIKANQHLGTRACVAGIARGRSVTHWPVVNRIIETATRSVDSLENHVDRVEFVAGRDDALIFSW